MATQLIGIGGQSVELKLTKFDKRLLMRYRAEAVFNRFGMKSSIGRNQGKAVSFRRNEAIYPAGNGGPSAAASAPSALTEGTPPLPIDATWSEVQATISQYGQVILVSDLTLDQSIDDVAGAYTENLSESMTDALELLTRDVLAAGTNVQYASTASSRAQVGSGMKLSLAELRAAKRTLKRANVPPPVDADGNYVVITHPDCMYDLESDSNITNIYMYSQQAKRSDELFSTSFRDLPLGFRVFETTNARVFASLGLSGANVYATEVIGREAYGTVGLEAQPARIIKKDRGSGGATGDPLDQVASIGWKAAHVAVILNQSALVRIEHIAS